MFQVARVFQCATLRSRPGLIQGDIIRHFTMETDWPVETSIRRKLTESLQPLHLDVINESFMHNVPKGSETHFKVVVVSKKFEEESLIKRHRLVNDILKEELEGPVHALSIQARTPAQWSQSTTVSKSPPCLGGMAQEQAQKDQGR